ncbi:MAG: 3-hydroxyacyl-CoA dehydrogenase [Syntrophaceae bacterium]
MTVSDIKKVLILGAGTMGQQIGFVCAMHGYDVVMYDLSVDILEKSRRRMEKLGHWFMALGKLDEAGLKDTMTRVTVSADAAVAAADADFVSESVPEDPKIKAAVFAQFNALCPERTIFTTNTSMLVPSMFADSTGRPDRFAALHFHELRTSNVVDVMPHPGTSEEVVEVIEGFAKAIGQIVIKLHRENYGYVFNVMLSNLFVSALTLASKDVASVQDIDRAWMGVMQTAIGPFGIMDQVGLSTVWHITDYWAKRSGDAQSQTNADYLKQFVDKGHLGYKTSQGFYTYPNPAYGQPGFLSGKKEDQ